jgi:hypothetical protein
MKKTHWIDVPLSEVLAHFVKDYALDGEKLIEHEAFVDTAKGSVAFKLTTQREAEAPAQTLQDCPICKRTPNLFTRYLEHGGAARHHFQCDKCLLATGEYAEIEQASDAWSNLIKG